MPYKPAKFLFLFFRKWARWLLIPLALILLFLLADYCLPFRPQIAYSTLVTAHDQSILHAFLSPDDKWRMKTELEEISPALKKCLVYKEDRFFYYHFGFNPFAMLRALGKNIWHNKTTAGASTITMQVARLLEPKQRTYGNKLIELFRAMQLELHYSKAEILQMYLNLVPYGGNIEGVKSVAVLYFGQLPNKLSLAQTVTLTIIPNRPTSLRLGKNNALLVKARNKWLRTMAKDGLFEPSAIADALAEPLQARRLPSPALAPHLALRAKREMLGQPNIHTTIRRAKQHKVEQISYRYMQRLHYQGIHNASVIVINNRTHCIEAYLGSPDFGDALYSGQVDGVKAVRSPGSTLKPLVYAQAFDKGLLTPKTVVTDVPTDFEGYLPVNFDKKFTGLVTVEKALANSLNVPAVKTLDQVGLIPFIQKLKQAGFQQVGRDAHKLGLSVILGGCGVRLEELGNMYAAFANGGLFVPATYLQQHEPAKQPVRLVSEAAAYMVTEILSQVARPDLPNNYQSSYHVPKVAWKTGTSYGRKDAWSIGYNDQYTIGVWVGNFSAEGVPALTGTDMATPLLFELFNTLAYNAPNRWFARPAALRFRYVCAESGKLPNVFCKNEVIDYFLPLVSDNHRCQHMKEIFVAADEACSYCRVCLPANGYKSKLYPNLPPELIAYYEEKKIGYVKIPTHNPACTRIAHEHPPIITSPVAGRHYVLDPDEQTELMLACQADNEVHKVYWYINDKFYREAAPIEHIFFRPGKGAYKISCSDDQGRNTDIYMAVDE